MDGGMAEWRFGYRDSINNSEGVQGAWCRCAAFSIPITQLILIVHDTIHDTKFIPPTTPHRPSLATPSKPDHKTADALIQTYQPTPSVWSAATRIDTYQLSNTTSLTCEPSKQNTQNHQSSTTPIRQRSGLPVPSYRPIRNAAKYGVFGTTILSAGSSCASNLSKL